MAACPVQRRLLFSTPIQVVTAAEDGFHAFHKEASKIGVGDIVFCLVQDTLEYFAHIVFDSEHDYWLERPMYIIGKVKGRVNGYCHRVA